MSANSTRKVALVTGGSQGIGRAIGLRLAQDGWAVAVVAMDTPELAATTAEIDTLSQARGYAADLSATAEIPALVGKVAADFGGLDLVVNCAGATRRGGLVDLADEDWQHGFSVKFFGTVAVTRAAWPHLVASGGSVVTIAGALGHTPSADSLIGGAICSALINFCKALAETGRRDGVRVNSINPGWIDTGRLDSMLEQKAARDGHGDRERAGREFVDELKILRFGQPGDVAELVAYLSDGRGSFIHGASIDIDGGLTKGV
ncbi:SDR family NAD(P)-dependent oxidoreductase [Stappia indica]|uniref:SDR family oxidoreductase n=1 Tax=Stappia indica TaxID=538381 RepID=A0A857CCN7_9HYPH|nr:SDR family oxidoreductase [Stappia indica]QGZ36628.1 SDR family oxidoreductase [Stappia indica]